VFFFSFCNNMVLESGGNALGKMNIEARESKVSRVMVLLRR